MLPGGEGIAAAVLGLGADAEDAASPWAFGAAPFGLRMIAYDPFVEEMLISEYGVQPATLSEVLSRSEALQKTYAMRQELSTLWARSTASKEQLVQQLQDWCVRAEQSGVAQLRDFSLRLRSYA